MTQLSAEQLQVLDPSICQIPGLFIEREARVPEGTHLFHYRGLHTQAKRSFWTGLRVERWFTLREDWSPEVTVTGFEAEIEPMDFDLIPEERIESFNTPSDIIREPEPVQVSWAFSQLMRECTPQFILRNLPRASRDVNLQAPLWFDLEETSVYGSFDEIDDSRETEIPRPEWMEFWTFNFVDDFRIFLEEVLYLCPWHQMPMHKRHDLTIVEAGVNLWDTAHSRAQLTVSLMERARSGSIFAIGTAGRLFEIPTGPRRRKVVARRKSRLPDEAVRPLLESTVGGPPPLEDTAPPQEEPPFSDDDEPMG